MFSNGKEKAYCCRGLSPSRGLGIIIITAVFELALTFTRCTPSPSVSLSLSMYNGALASFAVFVTWLCIMNFSMTFAQHYQPASYKLSLHACTACNALLHSFQPRTYTRLRERDNQPLSLSLFRLRRHDTVALNRCSRSISLYTRFCPYFASNNATLGNIREYYLLILKLEL